jgi:phosphate transport system protein
MPEGTEHEPARPVRTEFHRSLDQMDDAFVEAGAIVAESLPRLTRAFLAGNKESIQDARSMAADVQDRCRHVEEAGFVTLAREAPVAGDLRRLVALLRLVVDVDRSAALLKHVSETLDRFDPRDLPEPLREQLTDLGERATDVFRRGLDAWRSKDALAITEVDEADEGVDRLQKIILDQAARVDQAGDEMLVLGLIARYYERIADHGVALARDATFVVTAERVTLPSRAEG